MDRRSLTFRAVSRRTMLRSLRAPQAPRTLHRNVFQILLSLPCRARSTHESFCSASLVAVEDSTEPPASHTIAAAVVGPTEAKVCARLSLACPRLPRCLEVAECHGLKTSIASASPRRRVPMNCAIDRSEGAYRKSPPP